MTETTENIFSPEKKLLEIFNTIIQTASNVTKPDIEQFLTQEVLYKQVGEPIWKDRSVENEETSVEILKYKFIIGIHRLTQEEKDILMSLIKKNPGYNFVGIHDLENLMTIYLALMQVPPAPKPKKN